MQFHGARKRRAVEIPGLARPGAYGLSQENDLASPIRASSTVAGTLEELLDEGHGFPCDKTIMVKLHAPRRIRTVIGRQRESLEHDGADPAGIQKVLDLLPLLDNRAGSSLILFVPPLQGRANARRQSVLNPGRLDPPLKIERQAAFIEPAQTVLPEFFVNPADRLLHPAAWAAETQDV